MIGNAIMTGIASTTSITTTATKSAPDKTILCKAAATGENAPFAAVFFPFFS
jgi:hypothetical protein